MSGSAYRTRLTPLRIYAKIVRKDVARTQRGGVSEVNNLKREE